MVINAHLGKSLDKGLMRNANKLRLCWEFSNKKRANGGGGLQFAAHVRQSMNDTSAHYIADRNGFALRNRSRLCRLAQGCVQVRCENHRSILCRRYCLFHVANFVRKLLQR